MPPHLNTNIPPSRPPNAALQHPSPDPGHRAPTPPPPNYSPVTPELSTSLPAILSNQPTSSKYTPFPDPPAPPPSASLPVPHTHVPRLPQQPRLHLNGPTPLKARPQPPAPEPISLEENSDAIALRAAISILQLQRQQALKDMVTLEKQKTAALGDVQGFVEALAAGRGRGGVRMRGATGILATGSEGDEETAEEDEEKEGRKRHGDGDDKYEDDANMEGPVGQEDGLGGADRGGSGGEAQMRMEIPSAQNVVRMPPVNWKKYHVVGETLEKLHKEQKVRPANGVVEGERKEAVVAAAYDPFVDRLEAVGRGQGGKGGGINGGNDREGLAEEEGAGISARRKSGGGGRRGE